MRLELVTVIFDTHSVSIKDICAIKNIIGFHLTLTAKHFRLLQQSVEGTDKPSTTQNMFPVTFSDSLRMQSDKGRVNYIFERFYTGAVTLRKKRWEGKLSLSQSYLASFDQKEWWIRKDSEEVSS